MRMKRVYIPYTEWEDWENGMWNQTAPEGMIQKAIEFTGNAELYGSWMERVVNEWPRTMLNSLTNPSVNKRAFVGHCAVCLAIGCPEYITRLAWKQLNQEQRDAADEMAEKIISAWFKRYGNI